MIIGEESPQWAKDLLNKWIELDDKFFQCTHNVFVFYTDVIDCGASIRIFAELEQSARDSLIGKREVGLFATFIEPNGYRVIPIPEGLVEWTKDFIEKH